MLDPKDWTALLESLMIVTPPSLDSDLADADGYMRRFMWRYLFPALDRLGSE